MEQIQQPPNLSIEEAKWYTKTWVIIFALVFVAPIGIVLMWKYTNWGPWIRYICTGIFIAVFIIFLFLIESLTRGIDSIYIFTYTLSDDAVTIDVDETKHFPIKLYPDNANPAKLEYHSDDESIVRFNYDGSVIGLQEGTANIYASYKDVSSNVVQIVVVDKERLLAEEKQKLQDQTNAVIEQINTIGEPTLDNKAAIDTIQQSYDNLPEDSKALVTNANTLKKAQTKIAELEQAEQERLAAEQAAQQQTQQPETNGQTVYRTPTGKRYHYDNSCNGGKYSPISLDEAIRAGLTPCQKCT